MEPDDGDCHRHGDRDRTHKWGRDWYSQDEVSDAPAILTRINHWNDLVNQEQIKPPAESDDRAPLNDQPSMTAEGPRRQAAVTRLPRRHASEPPHVEAQFRTVFEAAVIGMALVRLDGHFLFVNQAFSDITGYSRDALTSMTFQAITHPEDLAEDIDMTRQLLEGQIRTYQIEKRYLHRDGHEVWIELSVSLVHDDTGNAEYFIAQIQEITERKRFEDQLLHQAFHDHLTGLPNRALFMDRLEHALARAKRPGETLAVLFLDLDNFKVINDSLGHRAGDQLLVTMAERLQGCVRPGDTVSRLGGDEFTVLLENISGIADAIRVAQRIAEQSLTLYSLHDRQVAVTASIGIALGAPEDVSADDLVRNADTAMYEAKRRGRARFEVFNPKMTIRARERLETEIALQRAVERGEFVLHYQPIIQLATDRVVELEALVRWDHPAGGLLTPGGFLPVAGEAGRVRGVGDWVLRRACRQLLKWQRQYPAAAGEPPLRMSVNLSTRQFLQSSLVADIDRVLGQTGLDPHSLKLEITESVVMEDAAGATETLRGLRDLGITLAIDDFGTGYSSLTYLKRFDVDTLKIDRQFMAGVPDDPDHTAIVNAVIAIARTLGIKVIAEGIETREQLEHLRSSGCDYAQGMLLGPPLPEAEIEELLAARGAHEYCTQP